MPVLSTAKVRFLDFWTGTKLFCHGFSISLTTGATEIHSDDVGDISCKDVVCAH